MSVTIYPQAKVGMLVNAPPTIAEDDAPLLARFMVTPWDSKFVKDVADVDPQNRKFLIGRPRDMDEMAVRLAPELMTLLIEYRNKPEAPTPPIIVRSTEEFVANARKYGIDPFKSLMHDLTWL